MLAKASNTLLSRYYISISMGGSHGSSQKKESCGEEACG